MDSLNTESLNALYSNTPPSDASLKLNRANGHSGDDDVHITVSKILIHPIKVRTSSN